MDVTAENSSATWNEVVRECGQGALTGCSEDGVCRFFNVPYAAPPVGKNRFREPQPADPWTGVRDATAPGATAYYRVPDFPGIDIAPLVGTGNTEGDDFLTLNIWAPEDAQSRPVMVWIHGGAFVVGSKDASVQDGRAFAKSGLVCVAINYRLGIDGFLPIPGVPTNLGLRDMIAALHWVLDNIAAFGGDPGNVTIFGESAGAMAIADLVTSPLTKGLFQRAIIQSGHGAMVRDIPTARRLVRKLARMLRIKPDAEGFRTVDSERGWRAMEKVGKPLTRIDLRDEQGYEPLFGLSRFCPIYGDDVLPEKPHEALEKGAGSDVEILIGTNAEEMNFYFVPTGVKKNIRGWLATWLLRKSLPAARDTLRSYALGGAKRPGEAFTDAMTDLVFRWPARQFAEKHQGRTHLYEFEWRSPRFDGQLGACHGTELPFVFKTLPSVSGPSGLVGGNPPQELADRLHRIWVDFATNGELPWPEFDCASRNVHLLASNRTIYERPLPAAPFLP